MAAASPGSIVGTPSCCDSRSSRRPRYAGVAGAVRSAATLGRAAIAVENMVGAVSVGASLLGASLTGTWLTGTSLAAGLGRDALARRLLDEAHAGFFSSFCFLAVELSVARSGFVPLRLSLTKRSLSTLTSVREILLFANDFAISIMMLFA